MIAVRCNFCGNELVEPGGLLFSPPLNADEWTVVKLHVCRPCWPKVAPPTVDADSPRRGACGGRGHPPGEIDHHDEAMRSDCECPCHPPAADRGDQP